MTSNLLTEVQATVTARMQELRPAYLEYLELEAYAELTGKFESPVQTTEEAQAALDAAPSIVTPVEAPAPAKPTATKKPAAPRQRPGSKKPAAKAAAKAKPKAAAKPAASDGETVAKVLEIVAAHNDTGIKVGEIIAEGDLSQSYTYDVVKRLTEAKQLVKRNRKIYLHQNAATTAARSREAQAAAA